jgi:3-deoxy-D-manno-octulosonate 8-phosphate phosphatase (KDO 8-P phosphatase)
MVSAVPTARRARLPAEEAARRARALRLVVTDCDGVLTDAGVYYSERGEELKRFTVRDGMGVELLRDAGIATAILTREAGGAVVGRARKLRLEHVFLGVRDKAAFLGELCARTGVPPAAIAYIGDDVNDLGLLDLVGREGLTGAPADAIPEVAAAVHYLCATPGGRGAFREFADYLLRTQQHFTGETS